jgi:hypothetical protein
VRASLEVSVDRERAVHRILAYLEEERGMILRPRAAEEILSALDRDDMPPDSFDLRYHGQHVVVEAADFRRVLSEG